MTILDESSDSQSDENVPDISPLDFIFYQIENNFSQLINFQPGFPSIDIQYKEVLTYFQSHSWDHEVDDDTNEISQEFNHETYEFVLETFIFKLMEYFNLIMQYVAADKAPVNSPNEFQKIIKTSCFWKMLVMDFAKVPRDAAIVGNSWDAEITNSSALYDFLPPSFQNQVREYLEFACLKTYKTEEPIQQEMIV